MSRFTRRWAALLVAFTVAGSALLAATAASGRADRTEAAATPVKIAWFTALGNTYLEAVLAGMKDEARKAEGVSIRSFDSQFDPTKQYNQIQDAITSKKYNAFLIFGFGGPALVPVSKQAIAAGIKVIDVNYPIGKSFSTSKPQVAGMSGAVMIPAVETGKALGNLTLRACRGKSPCKVAYLPGFDKSPFDVAVYGSFKQVIAKNAAIEVVAKQEGKLLADPAFGVIQTVLQANSDLNVVTAAGDQMASGAEKAINAAGKKGQVEIIGASASQIGVKAVRQGRWFGTTTDLPRYEGVLSARLGIAAVRGKPIKKRGLNQVSESGYPPFFSRENISKFPKSFNGEWKG